eukprot:3811919-Prymnesium_polylepis.1
MRVGDISARQQSPQECCNTIAKACTVRAPACANTQHTRDVFLEPHFRAGSMAVDQRDHLRSPKSGES